MSAVPVSITSAVDEIRALLGERLSTSTGVRDHHSKDESWHIPHRPDAVAFPNSTEEVADIVRICARHRTPVVAYGTGTSLEGAVIPEYGGVVVDLANLNQIIKVNVDDLDVTVQARVTRKQLNEHLRDTGLFFPIDPGADASLGGMAATRASGTNAVRYGTMRENVLALTVVLADGRVIRTSRRARKSAAGYDLTRLFVGSEGTLGVFTELTIKLVGLPNSIAGAVVTFPDAQSAVTSAVGVIQAGVPVARMEYVDALAIRAVNQYKGLSLREAPTLFLEFHGNQAAVQEDANLTAEICAAHGGQGFAHSLDPNERARLWEARHHAWFALKAAYPGKHMFSTDVAVPISRLPESLAFAQALLVDHNLIAPVVGHVGDGNYHLLIVHDPQDTMQTAQARAVNEALIRQAIGLGGTATGEHGVGIGKRKFMSLEHGPALEVMRGIKRSLDPLGIMNPGKLVDDLEQWPPDEVTTTLA